VQCGPKLDLVSSKPYLNNIGRVARCHTSIRRFPSSLGILTAQLLLLRLVSVFAFLGGHEKVVFRYVGCIVIRVCQASGAQKLTYYTPYSTPPTMFYHQITSTRATGPIVFSGISSPCTLGNCSMLSPMLLSFSSLEFRCLSPFSAISLSKFFRINRHGNALFPGQQ